MKKQLTICDACGKEVPNHETRYRVTIPVLSAERLTQGFPSRGYLVVQGAKSKELDFCKFCFTGPVKAALETLTYTLED